MLCIRGKACSRTCMACRSLACNDARLHVQGWPGMYFREPLVMTDAATGIHWYGIDTANASNSRPGRWEAAGMGCCHERDRHVRMETRALEHVFRCVTRGAHQRMPLAWLA